MEKRVLVNKVVNHFFNLIANECLERAIRLIDDPTLTAFVDTLAHQRSVSALSLFYRYDHGMFSDELKSVIPPMTSRNWNSLPASVFPHTYNLNSKYLILYVMKLLKLLFL